MESGPDSENSKQNFAAIPSVTRRMQHFAFRIWRHVSLFHPPSSNEEFTASLPSARKSTETADYVGNVDSQIMCRSYRRFARFLKFTQTSCGDRQATCYTALVLHINAIRVIQTINLPNGPDA